MTETSHAVFLSYASQDAQAAQKICEALRTAGIEVFLDQSELRGGDAWDQKIRREIRDCALFVPVISVNTADSGLAWLKVEPLLDPLRKEPRFQALMRKLKFPS